MPIKTMQPCVKLAIPIILATLFVSCNRPKMHAPKETQTATPRQLSRLTQIYIPSTATNIKFASEKVDVVPFVNGRFDLELGEIEDYLSRLPDNKIVREWYRGCGWNPVVLSYSIQDFVWWKKDLDNGATAVQWKVEPHTSCNLLLVPGANTDTTTVFFISLPK